MQLDSTRHSVYLCNYHIIFIPKYRRHVLTGEITEKLKEIFYEIAYKYEMGDNSSGDNARPHTSICISTAKICTVIHFKVFQEHIFKMVKKYFPDFAFKALHTSTRAYFVSTAGNASGEIIKQYIEMQWDRENEKRNQG